MATDTCSEVNADWAFVLASLLSFNNLSARRVTGLVPWGSSLAGTRLACHTIGGVKIDG